MGFKFSETSLERLEGVHPTLVEIFKTAIEHPECPEDFGIPEFGGRRTLEDQKKLFAIGRSSKGVVVTKSDGVVNKSNHQEKEDGFGHAVDVYIYDHKTKKAVWDKQRLAKLAAHIIKIALEVYDVNVSWGGNWKNFKDYPHFEAKNLLGVIVKEVGKKVKDKIEDVLDGDDIPTLPNPDKVEDIPTVPVSEPVVTEAAIEVPVTEVPKSKAKAKAKATPKEKPKA